MTNSYVYELIADDDTRLYVGCTRNFESRLGQHRRGQEWWPQVKRIIVDVIPAGTDAFAEERRRIRIYQPVHNVAGLGDGPDARLILPITGPWLTAPTAAQHARIRVGAIYQAIAAGELRARRATDDATWEIHIDSIDAWLRGENRLPA